MSFCQQIGRWITDNVVTPLEEFFQRAHQQCAEARRWVEHEIREPIERWREQQEQRCREQECNWWCLCCNKWFCWLVTVVVRFIEWIIRIVGEWIVEVVCNIVVEIVRIVVLVIVQVAKFIVEAVVCFVERFCSYLFLLAGVALIALLVGVVVTIGTLPFAALPAVAGGAAVAAAAILLALTVCDWDRCRLLGLLVWAFKWSAVIGAIVAFVTINGASGMMVAIYGGVATALIWALSDRACPIPRLLGTP